MKRPDATRSQRNSERQKRERLRSAGKDKPHHPQNRELGMMKTNDGFRSTKQRRRKRLAMVACRSCVEVSIQVDRGATLATANTKEVLSTNDKFFISACPSKRFKCLIVRAGETEDKRLAGAEKTVWTVMERRTLPHIGTEHGGPWR